MRLLETKQVYRAETEDEAKQMMEAFRAEAVEKGYLLKKSGYEYKSKKSKGEVIDEAYVVTIVQEHGGIWE